MKSLQKNKGVVITAVIVILVIFVYKSLFKQSADIASQGETARNVGGDLVALFHSLEGVTLNQDLFKNNIYRSLADFSTSLPNLPVGRSNPFDVIGR